MGIAIFALLLIILNARNIRNGQTVLSKTTDNSHLDFCVRDSKEKGNCGDKKQWKNVECFAMDDTSNDDLRPTCGTIVPGCENVICHADPVDPNLGLLKMTDNSHLDFCVHDSKEKGNCGTKNNGKMSSALPWMILQMMI